MELPDELRYPLHQGEKLATEVAAQPGSRAWVWVRPIMASGKTFAEALAAWNFSRRASESYDDSVVLFQVRRIELSEWHLSYLPYDLDSALEQRPAPDEVVEVASENQLAEILSRWVGDLSRLKAPHLVEYPEPPPPQIKGNCGG